MKDMMLVSMCAAYVYIYMYLYVSWPSSPVILRERNPLLFPCFSQSKIENIAALLSTLLQYKTLKLVEYCSKKTLQIFRSLLLGVQFSLVSSAKILPTELWVEGTKFLLPKEDIYLLLIQIWLISCLCKQVCSTLIICLCGALHSL